MPLYLKYDDKQDLPGMTYVSDPLLGKWPKDTGIYIPPGVETKGKVNVLLWLHGYYVRNIDQFLHKDDSQVREQILASRKNVILIAPFLGHGEIGASGPFYAGIAEFKGAFGENYINNVLHALAPNPAKYTTSNLTLAGLAQTADTSPLLKLGKLVIACHSGGGAAMRALVGALGKYTANLAECWGFDCLYGEKGIDDATLWSNWAMGSNGRPLYVFYGWSTAAQSVKLDLIGRGVADTNGTLRNPRGPNMQRLNVKLGIPDPRPIRDLMGIADLDMPAPKRSPAVKSNIAATAASNVRRNANWPADSRETHYAIARDGLLERLKGAAFL
jgi:hypothetical protein